MADFTSLKYPLPPFTQETAQIKVKAAQDAWNTRNPEVIKYAYTPNSIWRNRSTFLTGSDEIVTFLTQKWKIENGYRLRKELFSFTDNKIAVQFWYEWHDEEGQWWRTYGLEDWTFAPDGRMRKRMMSGNDVKIEEKERWFKDEVDVNEVEISERHCVPRCLLPVSPFGSSDLNPEKLNTRTMASDGNLGVVLVIGGCGFLGSRLVKTILSSHQEVESVHVMSRSPTQNLHPKATYHAGDIKNHDHVSCLLEKIKPTVIFHTASPKYTDSEALLCSTNVDATRVLLECATASPSVKAFVYTGTDSAIVQSPGVRLTEETAKLHTEKSSVNAYAKTKAIADIKVREANNPEKLRTAVIRIPGLYGEDDDNCVGTLLGSVKKNQHKIQLGDNKRHFEFVYIESACMAHILAAKALLNEKEETKVGGEAFFISDDVSMPYFDFARKIYAGAGYPVEKSEIKVMSYEMILVLTILGEWIYWIFTFGTRRPSLKKEGIEYLAGGTQWDISKAKERLGYQPVADQDAIIRKVAEWEAKRLGIWADI
ncbi:hypothetical protein HYALB_00008594 [Hymenoscyphus albidus]|uniref:3-beta hydroxysteroid dehydrogenase/isomerase domain-containing protein n=1 Tax=Hymenoscyphus albidus TaxID=595503 RepID=A0A9N9Q187_9HELO|nr:hypothetical protein HYALB_00008594 [Hymenoscyphus albidus]